MLTRPDGLTDAALAEALSRWWEVHVEALELLPVGFGSHHWSALDADSHRWFVTVDDLDAKARSFRDDRTAVFARLRAALSTARAAEDAGADFVVAPVPTLGGDAVQRITDRFALALYPHVDGRTYDWGEYGSASDRTAILDLLVTLHASPGRVTRRALVDDFVIPHGDELERARDELGTPWDAGPYSEPARELLARHRERVERLLARHDQLVEETRRRPGQMVLTHGEPHLANAIRTETGWVLVDWDTTLIAPPERDLWFLEPGDGSVVTAYEEATGQSVSPSLLELYRVSWNLAEIAIYTALFRQTHTDTRDTAEAWKGLHEYLTRASLT